MDTDARPPAAARTWRPSQTMPSTAEEAPQPAPSGADRARRAADAGQQQQAPGVKVTRKKFEHVKVRF